MFNKNLGSVILSSFSYLDSIADLRLPKPKFKSVLKPDAQSDCASLKGDWEQVGKYLYESLNRVDDEQKNSKKKQ